MATNLSPFRFAAHAPHAACSRASGAVGCDDDPVRGTHGRRGTPPAGVGAKPVAAAWIAACAAIALVAGCRSAGPYGYSRVYTPTSDETQAVKGKAELDPRGVQRSPQDRTRGCWAFGVVTHRAPGPGGAAYVALSLRALQPRNRCQTLDEDTCRVTVSDREMGRAHALVTLTAEDDLGERSVALGSLLRVVGNVAEDVDPSDGSPILRAAYYRHWPRGFYTSTTGGSPAPAR